MWKYSITRLAIFAFVTLAATALTFYVLHSLKLDLTPVVGYGDIQHMLLPVATLWISLHRMIPTP